VSHWWHHAALSQCGRLRLPRLGVVDDRPAFGARRQRSLRLEARSANASPAVRRPAFLLAPISADCGRPANRAIGRGDGARDGVREELGAGMLYSAWCGFTRCSPTLRLGLADEVGQSGARPRRSRPASQGARLPHHWWIAVVKAACDGLAGVMLAITSENATRFPSAERLSHIASRSSNDASSASLPTRLNRAVATRRAHPPICEW
jgi:hypothetical protein